MLNFKKIELSDLPKIRSAVEKTEYKSCQLSVGSLYCLAEKYDTQLCFDGDFLFVKQVRKEFGTCYFLPIGTGNLAEALQKLQAYNTENYGGNLTLWGIADDMVEDFRAAGKPYESAELTSDRDWAEYIHAAQNLLTLQGKRLQPKRNAVNQFKRNFPDYQFEKISDENMAEILAFQQQQMAEKDEELDAALQDENRAIERTLKDFRTIGLTGGIIRVEGKIRAFAIGSPINKDSFDILFEKAEKDFNGIYQVLEQELIKNELQLFSYINREEDLGIPGLRFAKQGLQPDILLMKYTAKLTAN
ncbi:MAG: phosphatidylglycerol lysyltransferase domain-containing protein [Prevotellaceae bacterium]|jgi:hypothetical protein|nr:phosphatidylglycerol lysyltransferase domain-containing protein [Prevotellaceae bacterium]